MISTALLLALAATPQAKTPAKTTPVAHEGTTGAVTSEFETLRRAYAGALLTYDEERQKADSGRGPQPKVHPAKTFWQRFEALGSTGDPDALGWLLENARAALDEPKVRAEKVRALFGKLLATNAEHEAMFKAVSGVQANAEDIGRKEALALLDEVVAKSKLPEAQARAEIAKAAIVTEGWHTTDAAKRDEGREYLREAVMGFATSKAAKEAAGMLFPEVERTFLDAEKKWLDAVRAAQAAGKPPSEWPRQAIHGVQPLYLPLAGAGHQTSQAWTESFYPAYAQTEKLGPGQSLAWLAHNLGQVYSPADPEWSKFRCGLLRVLYAQFPDGPWVAQSVRDLRAEIERMPAGVAEDTIATLLEKNRDDKFRAQALDVLARTRRAGGDQKSYERAIEAWKKLLSDYGDEEPAENAKKDLDLLQSAMPGVAAPDIPPAAGLVCTDADGLAFNLAAYKGRVTVIQFFRLSRAASQDDAKKLATLSAELKDRPFVLLGACMDRVAMQSYHPQTQTWGMTWRVVLIEGLDRLVQEAYQLRRESSIFVLDDKGVIRGRDLPWDETEKLVRGLVDPLAQRRERDVPPK
jgi:hypothetical protein